MADEFICDTLELRQFIGAVKEAISRDAPVEQRLEEIRPHFSRLMAKSHWLPAEFRRTLEAGGMGTGVANWLLYREAEGRLTLSALVLPSGVATPVHDHLAWGLVGLYVGEQDEEVYAVNVVAGGGGEHADVRMAEKKHLNAGSIYELIPPANDIHRVVATSAEPSISLHLLANDVGCTMRHRFEPETGRIYPLLSGYSNRACAE